MPFPRELNLKHCNLGFEGAMVALRWTQQESCQLTSLNLNSTFSLEGVESVKLLVDACRGAPNNGPFCFNFSYGSWPIRRLQNTS